MDPHDLLPRHREHAEGVVGAQVLLGGEWEFAQILKLPEIVRMHAGRGEGGSVVGDVVPNIAQGPGQAIPLQRGDFVAGRGFDPVEPGHGQDLALRQTS